MTLARLAAFALSASTCALAFPALAQEAENHHELTIGAGVGYVPSYEGSDDYLVIPVAAVRGKVADFAFWTRGTSLYVDAIPNRSANGVDIQLGPVVNVRLDRTSRIKDAQVRALGKLDTAIEVGGFFGIGKTGVITSDYDNLSFRVSWVKDVNDAHGSYVVTPAVEYMAPLSTRTFVGFGASAEYVGKGYGRYYFDVNPAGTTSTLPAYSGAGDDEGFKKISLALTGGYSLSGDLRKGLALFAIGGYSRMLGDYGRSPVVAIAGDKNQWIGAVGIGYTF